MDAELDGRLYGTLYGHIVGLARDEGLENAIVAMNAMTDFEIRMILAHLVNVHAKLA